MQTVTQFETRESVGIYTILLQAKNLDNLLEIASKFSIGQLLLSRRAQGLLIRLLERQAKRNLRPGDEIRQLNVSLKREKNGSPSVLLQRGNNYAASNNRNRQLKMLLHNGTY